MVLLLASLLIVGTAYAIARGVDVRLALLVSAFVIASIAGAPASVSATFLATFSDEKFVVPICSAMGFAYVLRQTECDRHLVQLLIRPIRRLRFLLIPGVAIVGFLVNIPVISQTSTAVCLGPVVVPLMRAANISPITTGATLLLGSSVGGELLNPGAPELNTVARTTQSATQEIIPYVVPWVFPQLALSLALFWWLSQHTERRFHQEQWSAPGEALASAEATTADREFRVHWLRAMIPLVPLVLLFLTSKPLEWFHIPEAWVVAGKPGDPKNTAAIYSTRLIGFAMLIGVVLAALSTPRQTKEVAKAFFDGAGYAFANVVALIVTANCFGTAVEKAGFAALLGETLRAMPNLLLPLTAALPVAFGVLSGSGMASTQSLYPLIAEAVTSAQADGQGEVSIELLKDLGGLVSVGAAAGRTMSPVSAVALMCAALTQTHSFTLTKQVALPLLGGLAILVASRMLFG